MLGFELFDLSPGSSRFWLYPIATDPASILAILNQGKVDPKLYTIIVCESSLNDVASNIMFKTLTKLDRSETHAFSIFHGTGIFSATFGVSMVLGAAPGLGAPPLKYSSLNHHPHTLARLVAFSRIYRLFTLEWSGIVSLLFCGTALKHYAYYTKS